MSEKQPPSCHSFVAASPLWSRAPARDENGKPCVDFMMLIPGLKHADSRTVESYMYRIQNCLSEFGPLVVYLDLNIKLSLLWVSAKSVPGISRHMVEAIIREIPHAKVVAGDFNPENFVERKPPPLLRIGRRVMTQLRLVVKSSVD
jgi:hypothetical protein